MNFHTATLQHLRFVSTWAWQRNAVASIDAQSFQLRVECAGQQRKLFPRFVLRSAGRLAYTSALRADGVSGFIGWLPYEMRQWPLAIDKLDFKLACAGARLPTPCHWTHLTQPDRDFIIKPARGSFGIGLRGPYRGTRGLPAGVALDHGDFSETYIDGPAIKVWYWRSTPLCVEVLDPLVVQGDGQSNVLSLTERSFDVATGERRTRFLAAKDGMNAILRYQNVDWSTVLAPGQRITVDFIYGSPLRATGTENTNRLSTLEPQLDEQVRRAGTGFLGMIPSPMRQDVLHAADGVIDRSGCVLWLEMNCNPMVPPDGYAIMLDDLFGFGSP